MWTSVMCHYANPSQLGDSHRLLGTIYLSEGDVASAEKHLKQVSQRLVDS